MSEEKTECNCMKDILEKVKTRLLEFQEPITATEMNFTEAFYDLSDFTLRTNSVIEYKYNKKLKNGNLKEAKDRVNIQNTYCPFCGVKHNYK